MPEPHKKYDSTVARIAGNIASGMMRDWLDWPPQDSATTCAVIVQRSVKLARAIVAEVERTDPEAQRAQALREMHETEQQAGNLNENAIRHPQDTGH